MASPRPMAYYPPAAPAGQARAARPWPDGRPRANPLTMRPMKPVPSQCLPDPLPGEPLQIAEKWLRQAFDEQVQPNPNAMVLATVGPQGQPSARVVLLKDIVLPEGYLVFYTNYGSRKGAELSLSPRAAAVLHWDTLQRQVRFE